MNNFGGAKNKPDAYNYQYIWTALDAMIKNRVEVYNLKDGDGFNLHDFGVVEDEPKS